MIILSFVLFFTKTKGQYNIDFLLELTTSTRDLYVCLCVEELKTNKRIQASKSKDKHFKVKH